MATSCKPVLFSYFQSSCSWRVRIALALKGIDYDIHSVNLLKKEQLSEDFKKVNPMAQVPALVIDGKTLIQSMSIMEYLEETRQNEGRQLLPEDPWKKARVRELCECIASGIQPLQNNGTILKLSPNDQEARTQWAQYWIQRGFNALESLLSSSAGKYCVGDEISMADCCLVPQVYNANRFRVDMSSYPTIWRIHKNLENLPEFHDSHPFRQPDCPPELKK